MRHGLTCLASISSVVTILNVGWTGKIFSRAAKQSKAAPWMLKVYSTRDTPAIQENLFQQCCVCEAIAQSTKLG